MKKYLLLVALVCYFLQSKAEEVRLLDLEPNDAQNIIEKQDQTLSYAPKIETDVPALRFIGEEQHNVLEDIYLAKQYHGQDGLGGYLYGYHTPNIAKNEKKKSSGDLKGSYNYVNGQGQEIRVQYWDNGTGFHQTDNIPQVAPQQIQDSPAVQAAKEAFLKRWHEEAERNSHPLKNPYDQYQKYQGAASGPQPAYAQKPQEDNEGAYYAGDEGKYVPDENEEPTGPPRGFFYAFDYPVGVITRDQGRALPVEQRSDIKNVYEENKQRFERQLQQGEAASGSQYLIN